MCACNLLKMHGFQTVGRFKDDNEEDFYENGSNMQWISILWFTGTVCLLVEGLPNCHHQCGCHQHFFSSSLYQIFPQEMYIARSALVTGAKGPGHDSVLCCHRRLPPSFLSPKTLQHYKCSGLNQVYFTRSLIINAFFVSSPGFKKNLEYSEVLHHNFTQCICTGHTGIGHSLSLYIL